MDEGDRKNHECKMMMCLPGVFLTLGKHWLKRWLGRNFPAHVQNKSNLSQMPPLNAAVMRIMLERYEDIRGQGETTDVAMDA